MDRRRQALRERQLKPRARRAVRPVPVPPVLIALLRAHLDTFDTTPEGRLFSAVRGGPIRSQDYGAVWKEARRKAFTAAQVASPQTAIPYDPRHACVSFWLRSGVSLPRRHGERDRASLCFSGTTPRSWTARTPR